MIITSINEILRFSGARCQDVSTTMQQIENNQKVDISEVVSFQSWKQHQQDWDSQWLSHYFQRDIFILTPAEDFPVENVFSLIKKCCNYCNCNTWHKDTWVCPPQMTHNTWCRQQFAAGRCMSGSQVSSWTLSSPFLGTCPPQRSI